MKTVNVNGVWYDVHSPSLYACRDVPGVSICFKERNTRKTKIIRKKIKGKCKKFTKIETVVVREWVVINTDNNTKLKFASLSEACYQIGLAFADLNAENQDEDMVTP